MAKETKKDQVIKELRRMIADLRGKENCFLPSERNLCEILGVSRVTLRRALAVVEEEKLLVAGRKSRLITGRNYPRQKGTIAFLADGIDRFILPAWHRLWEKVNQEAQVRGYRSRLLFYNRESRFNPEDVAGADYIIYTGCAIGKELMQCKDLFPKIIGTYEGYQGLVPNIVALDNYAAGKMAAEQLLEAGYRHPGFIGYHNDYLGFTKRCEGFVDTLNAAGTPPAMIEWIEGDSLGTYVRNFLLKSDTLITPDMDSLFVCSDEGICIFCDLLARRFRIPDEFGLITVGGSHQGLYNYPPITSVSHATTKVAMGIFDLIEEMRRHRVKTGKTVLLDPSVHPGMTVRKVSEDSMNKTR